MKKYISFYKSRTMHPQTFKPKEVYSLTRMFYVSITIPKVTEGNCFIRESAIST